MKKKIIIVIGSLELGGTEKQILHKLKYLKNNFNFKLVIFQKRGFLYKDFKKLGIEIIDLTDHSYGKILKYSLIFFKMLFTIKKIQPDIVNFYLPHSYLIGGFTSFFFKNISFIMSRRSMNFYQRKFRFIGFIETKFLHKKMKLIIANSKAIKNQLFKEEGVPVEKIKVINNFIEFPHLKKISKKNVNILFIANLIPYKNHKLVIMASNLIKKNLNYKIHIIGEGEEKYSDELMSLINKSKLNNKFIFHGKLANYSKIAQISDIGILSSNEEGLSNAILEYMALKLPVIATNVGGNKELIINNKNGYIVEKGDYNKFASYLQKLIISKPLRDRLGNKSYEIITKRFNIEKTIKKYEDLYCNL